MKYQFPMAFTTTVLSWSVIEYKQELLVADQLKFAHENIRWATDYFLKAVAGPTRIWVQATALIFCPEKTNLYLRCNHHKTVFSLYTNKSIMMCYLWFRWGILTVIMYVGSAPRIWTHHVLHYKSMKRRLALKWLQRQQQLSRQLPLCSQPLILFMQRGFWTQR